jgi:PAS domain S-box-containing protein
MNDQQPSTSRPRFKFHHLYFVLAAFDLLTIAISLWLSHQILQIHRSSVVVQSAWTARQVQLAELSDLAARVNAPGNDVFTTSDVPAETQRLDVTSKQYLALSESVRLELISFVPEAECHLLLGHLDATNAAMQKVQQEAHRIFERFQEGDRTGAGLHMSQMDQHFASALANISLLSRDVGRFQGESLELESRRAEALGEYEWVTMGLLICIVTGVVFYGHKLAGRIVQSELALKERNNDLEKHVIALRFTQDRLADQIAERESAEAREIRLGRIIEHSLNEIYVFSKTTLRFLEVNRGALRNLGYSVEEIHELTPLDLKPDHTMDSFVRLIEPLSSGTQDVIQFETVHRRKDGSLYAVEVHMQYAEWESETAFVAIILDVSERRKLQVERDEIQSQLVDASRQAGMAEIATGILHNVGNVLNSVNVSADLVMTKLAESRVTQLSKVAGLLDEYKADIGAFMTSDPKGLRIPGYIAQLADVLVEERDALQDELESLCENIEHIKEIVQVQQAYARRSGTEQELNMSEVVEMALKINESAITRHTVDVVREYGDIVTVVTDKHKVTQILINLITNAKNAISEFNGDKRTMTVRIRHADEHVCIAVQDSGMGIEQKNLTSIFTHGFTTREAGHGFGLHSSANAAVELGGSLSVSSDGPGQGAVFTLRLPIGKEATCTTV